LFKDFDGAYSSGSVQDFHLIPFSMRFPNGSSITKIVAKVAIYTCILIFRLQIISLSPQACNRRDSAAGSRRTLVFCHI
jgi:hypothetical protein